MEKLSTFRPSLVTKEFFPTYTDVSVINEGECFIWAYACYLLFHGVELWYTNHHAFVRYRGRFYDSERLRGVHSWAELPATTRGYIPFKNVNPADFKRAWDHPEKFYTSWPKIEAMARKVIKREQTSL